MAIVFISGQLHGVQFQSHDIANTLTPQVLNNVLTCEEENVKQDS